MSNFEWMMVVGVALIVYCLYEIEQSLRAILRRLPPE